MRKTLRHPLFEGGSYKDTGQGFPVILLHGFPEDGNIFIAQESFLKNDFRLIIPDLPGSGQSPLVNSLSIELMADFVHTILSAEKITACVMIGHSMGGYITLAFAEKYPQLLKGFGFFNSSAEADTEEKKTARLRSVEFMKTHGAAKFVRYMMPGLFSDTFKKEHPEKITALIQRSENFKTESLVAYYKAMMQRPGREPVLQQATIPVLFIAGKNDTVIPLKNILSQVILPAISVLHIFDDVAHMSMVETPAVNPALSHFIHFCIEAPFK